MKPINQVEARWEIYAFISMRKKILKDDNLIVIISESETTWKGLNVWLSVNYIKAKEIFSLLRFFYSPSLPSNYDTNNHLLHNFAKNGTTLKDLRNLQKKNKNSAEW